MIELTEQEKIVLKKLAESWNEFVLLDKIHPDEQNEFRQYLHIAQHLIARRVAARANPEIWYTLNE